MDNWLRSLNAEVTVKVVDACHSGVLYVKDDSFSNYLEKSKTSFKTCYFFFSSKRTQKSYQDSQELSLFTRNFVEAIQQHQTDHIRYRDISTFIADNFKRPNQTPTFVQQGTLTEKFCLITQEIRTLISNSLGEISEDINDDSQSKIEEEQSIVHFVKQDSADNYFSKEQVIDILKEIRQLIENHRYNSEFEELYLIEHLFETDHYSIPDKEIISKWLDKNEGKEKFFCEIEYEEEEYEVRSYGLLPMFNRIKTKIRNRPVSFNLTVDNLPYIHIQIKATPNYPSIPLCQCSILFFVSQTMIRFFFFYAKYKKKNWQDYKPLKGVKWASEELKFPDKEKIMEFISRIQTDFEYWIINQIKARIHQSS